MSREHFLASIAQTIQDYRAGEIHTPTPEHVDRWVRQFDPGVQYGILAEVDHVLGVSYLSRQWVIDFLGQEVANQALTGADPCTFWRAAHMLNIQRNGRSQAEMLLIFAEALHQRCGIDLNACGAPGGTYIYLDDGIYSGDRLYNDLAPWIRNHAPQQARIRILVIISHVYAEWKKLKELRKVAQDAGKNIDIDVFALVRIENRRTERRNSEVLWPTSLPQDPIVEGYFAQQDNRYPFEPRPIGGRFQHGVFSSEQGRQLLEREFLLAGLRIRGHCRNPKPIVRPLGYGPFGVGFGSTVVTYRNCPNNAPLALWWGDVNAPEWHPLRRWYPLFPRRTYEQNEADEF